MRVSVAVTAALAALALPGAAVAQQPVPGAWYWTPGACKSAMKRGVRLADGRYFLVQRSYCLGIGSACAWNSSRTVRMYRLFYVLARSYNGNVRSMYLHVTGKNASWVGQVRLRVRYMNATRFSVYTRIIVRSAATRENTQCTARLTPG